MSALLTGENRSPEQEGITTRKTLHELLRRRRENRSPEQEGITTASLRRLHLRLRCENRSPEQEGITTTMLYLVRHHMAREPQP